MPFPQLFRNKHRAEAAHALYAAAVDRARSPAFYSDMGVADSVDGRFDMVALHAFLLMRRLGAGGEAARQVSQALFDLMFADMDRSLREMGVGDLSVGKRIKQMAQAFYGRIAAYEQALGGQGEGLDEALLRNLYRGEDPGPERLARMAAYVKAADAALQAQNVDDVAAGRVALAQVG